MYGIMEKPRKERGVEGKYSAREGTVPPPINPLTADPLKALYFAKLL